MRCQLCDGTGTVHLMNSWFTKDGTRRSKCAICCGTGESPYRPEAEYVRQQKQLRDRSST
jgi:hypothetical protein